MQCLLKRKENAPSVSSSRPASGAVTKNRVGGVNKYTKKMITDTSHSVASGTRCACGAGERWGSDTCGCVWVSSGPETD